MFFDGGGGGLDPLSPSRFAHALHPPMSKIRAYVLLIFQCPGICLSPSQVDILVSDDSLVFCPTMYNRVFTWVETRAKSELRVRLVPLNMLILSSFSFYWSRFRRSSPWPLPRTRCVCACVCVFACVCVGGAGSRHYNHSNIYHDPAIDYSITCVDRPRCWWLWGGGGQWFQMHFTLTTLAGLCVRYITMEMSTDVK